MRLLLQDHWSWKQVHECHSKHHVYNILNSYYCWSKIMSYDQPRAGLEHGHIKKGYGLHHHPSVRKQGTTGKFVRQAEKCHRIVLYGPKNASRVSLLWATKGLKQQCCPWDHPHFFCLVSLLPTAESALEGSFTGPKIHMPL